LLFGFKRLSFLKRTAVFEGKFQFLKDFNAEVRKGFAEVRRGNAFDKVFKIVIPLKKGIYVGCGFKAELLTWQFLKRRFCFKENIFKKYFCFVATAGVDSRFRWE
jgi:hypothetical protein